VFKITELGQGSVIGEIAFVQDVERTATARALEPVKVMSMEWESTRKGLRLYPGIAASLNANISRILGERLSQTTRDLANAREASSA
jgi:CRP-like cAMP-binding protein